MAKSESGKPVDMSLYAEIRIETNQASSYLQRLCKHFGHKAEVEFTPDKGSIIFDFGRAQLEAAPDALTISAHAETEENLERLKRVMASHLERFAFREELRVRWE